MRIRPFLSLICLSFFLHVGIVITIFPEIVNAQTIAHAPSSVETQLIQLTPSLTRLSNLIAKSDLIARGQVVDVKSFWNHDRTLIQSKVTLKPRYLLAQEGFATSSPEQRWDKGVSKNQSSTTMPLATVVLYTSGGFIVDEGIGMASPHAASFQKGEEVIVFMKKEADVYTAVHGAEGKYLIEGKDVVNPDLTMQTSLGDLLQGIEYVLKNQGRQSLRPQNWKYLESAKPSVTRLNQPILSTQQRKWASPNTVVPFRINVNTVQVGGANGSVMAFRNAIIAAAQSWSYVSEADFTLSYAGPTSATQTGYNQINEVVFMHKGTHERAAAAQFWFTSDYTIVEADIWINDDFVWNTTGTPQSDELDLESVLLHEFGHWLVLGHYSHGKAVMYPKISLGVTKRSLHPYDIYGISQVYPCTNSPCLP